MYRMRQRSNVVEYFSNSIHFCRQITINGGIPEELILEIILYSVTWNENKMFFSLIKRFATYAHETVLTFVDGECEEGLSS